MGASPFKLLCGVGLFAIFSTTLSKSPTLPLLAIHLGGDPAGVGLVASVSAFTGILFSFPAGLLSDRLGRKRMLWISGLVFASAPFLYPLVRSLWQLALVRFYHGCATAVFVPVAMAYVSDLFVSGRGERMGWFSTSTLLGRFAAPATGGAILGLYPTDPGSGFPVVFLVCGITGLAAFAAISYLPPPLSQAGPAGAHTGWRQALRGLMTHRGILVTCFVEASILFAYGIFETFLPGYGLSVGLTASQVGLCLSSQVLTLALVKPVMGRFSDRYGRAPQIFGGTLIGGVFMALFFVAESFLFLVTLSVLLGCSISIVTSATSAHIADLSRRESYGSAMGVLGSLMDIGHTTGPIAGGVLATVFGLKAAFVGGAIVLLGAGVFFQSVRSREDRKPDSLPSPLNL